MGKCPQPKGYPGGLPLDPGELGVRSGLPFPPTLVAVSRLHILFFYVPPMKISAAGPCGGHLQHGIHKYCSYLSSIIC